jgi:hypothetical protein
MNYDRATQIARATTVLTPGKSLEVDAALYPLACEKTPRQLGEYLRKIIARVDPRGAADRAEKRKADRRVAIEHDQDEMSWLHAYLSSEDALAIDERLDLIARSIKREGSESHTMNQLRADAMRDLLLGKFSSKVTTHVYVACNATTLLGLDDLPGHLRGYGPVSAKKVREIEYKPTALLTEFIQLRDNTCTFPACVKPAQLSDTDHHSPYDHGGTTDEGNCGPRCRCHHRAKQSGQWTVTRGADGDHIWTSTTTGDSYLNRREPLVPIVAAQAPF